MPSDIFTNLANPLQSIKRFVLSSRGSLEASSGVVDAAERVEISESGIPSRHFGRPDQ